MLYWALVLFLPHQCGAEATDQETRQMVERINERYDDFYRRQREDEELAIKRDQAAKDINAIRLEQQKAMEKARETYVKERKLEAPNPQWEQEWNQQQQAWKEQNKMAGQRYVRERDFVESIERKGRMIPQMKEYDLDE